MHKRKIKLTVQYDGSDYHGWQIQPGQRTIQAEISDAVSRLMDKRIQVTGASRTDAGVSALGQTCLIKAATPIPTANLAKAITDRLPRDIIVTKAEDVHPDFDIIGAVTNKLYRYTIYTGPVRPILNIRHCWHLPEKLDIEKMQQAANHLVGKHDFKSFASSGDQRQCSVRTIFRCDVTKKDDWIYIETQGNGFLYNMVRNIVGTLTEVGTNRTNPDTIPQILAAKTRTAAGQTAPPNGLCLIWIKY